MLKSYQNSSVKSVSQIRSQNKSKIRKQYLSEYFDVCRGKLVQGTTLQSQYQKILSSQGQQQQQCYKLFLSDLNNQEYCQFWPKIIDRKIITKCLSFDIFKQQSMMESRLEFNANSSANSFQQPSIPELNILKSLILKGLVRQNLLMFLLSNLQMIVADLIEYASEVNRDKLVDFILQALELLNCLQKNKNTDREAGKYLARNYENQKQDSLIVRLHILMEVASQRVSSQTEEDREIGGTSLKIYLSMANFLELLIQNTKLMNQLFPLSLLVPFKDTIINDTIKIILDIKMPYWKQQGPNAHNRGLEGKSQSTLSVNQRKRNSYCIVQAYDFFYLLVCYVVQSQLQDRNSPQKSMNQTIDFATLQLSDESEYMQLWVIDHRLFNNFFQIQRVLFKLLSDLRIPEFRQTILVFLINLLLNTEIFQLLIDHDILINLTILLIQGKSIVSKREEDQIVYSMIIKVLIKLLRFSATQDIGDRRQRTIREYYTSQSFINCLGSIIFGFPVNSPSEWNYISIPQTKYVVSPLQTPFIFQALIELLQMMIKRYNMTRFNTLLEEAKGRAKNNCM